MLPTPIPIDLLDQINEQHATSFLLLDRYPTGEQGAFALADATGDRFVLKWVLDPIALTRRGAMANSSARLFRLITTSG